jgi:hypothetical protein
MVTNFLAPVCTYRQREILPLSFSEMRTVVHSHEQHTQLDGIPQKKSQRDMVHFTAELIHALVQAGSGVGQTARMMPLLPAGA